MEALAVCRHLCQRLLGTRTRGDHADRTESGASFLSLLTPFSGPSAPTIPALARSPSRSRNFLPAMAPGAPARLYWGGCSTASNTPSSSPLGACADWKKSSPDSPAARLVSPPSAGNNYWASCGAWSSLYQAYEACSACSKKPSGMRSVSASASPRTSMIFWRTFAGWSETYSTVPRDSESW